MNVTRPNEPSDHRKRMLIGMWMYYGGEASTLNSVPTREGGIIDWDRMIVTVYSNTLNVPQGYQQFVMRLHLQRHDAQEYDPLPTIEWDRAIQILWDLFAGQAAIGNEIANYIMLQPILQPVIDDDVSPFRPSFRQRHRLRSLFDEMSALFPNLTDNSTMPVWNRWEDYNDYYDMAEQMLFHLGLGTVQQLSDQEEWGKCINKIDNKLSEITQPPLEAPMEDE